MQRLFLDRAVLVVSEAFLRILEEVDPRKLVVVVLFLRRISGAPCSLSSQPEESAGSPRGRMVQGGGMRALIIGVGINLRRAPRRVRVNAPAAAALEDLLDPSRFQALDAGVLMETLLERLVDWTGRALREEYGHIRTAWLQHAMDGATCPIEEDPTNN